MFYALPQVDSTKLTQGYIISHSPARHASGTLAETWTCHYVISIQLLIVSKHIKQDVLQGSV
jgi:hypothetical protein